MDAQGTAEEKDGVTTPVTRRHVVAAAVVAAAAAVGCLPGCRTANPADGGPLLPETNPNGTVDVGTADDYPHDGVYDKNAASDRVYVVRKGGHLYALRSVCSHKACQVKPAAGADEFVCPCHGSRFELDGAVTKGPATRPLWHYAIAKSADGRLTVDKSKRFPAGQNDPAAAVTVA
jgi:cytochrome b6-f complex iron-sulfur subunit